MECIHGTDKLKLPLPEAAISIGNFDGLHKGHRVLIEQLLQISKERQIPSVVFTFYPHPLKVLAPDKDLRRLFLVDDLIEQLEQAGVDHLVLQPFSRRFSQLAPEDFLDQFLRTPLRPKAIVVGHDFRFGASRGGTIKTLESYCQAHQIDLNIIAPVAFEGGVVSSTRIRHLIASGQVEDAAKLLGREFYVKGVVAAGDGRGAKIGFPTANVRLVSESLPKAGVYVTATEVKGQWYPSVTNIGKNPTFLEQKTSRPMRVESHIFDFAEDIYGTEVRVRFYQFVREEKKFDSVESLVSQIQYDANLARDFFAKRPI